MYRLFTALLLTVLAGYPASAATTVDFDASVGGTGILVPEGPSVSGIACYSCGYLSPLFVIPAGEYAPGTVLDFGTLTLYPSPVTEDQYGDIGFDYDYFYQSTTGPLPYSEGLAFITPNQIDSAACGEYAPVGCYTQVIVAQSLAAANPIIQPLLVTVGTAELDIQFAWAFDGYETPIDPTPLPPALPMFASAMIGLLLLRHRKRRGEGL